MQENHDFQFIALHLMYDSSDSNADADAAAELSNATLNQWRRNCECSVVDDVN